MASNRIVAAHITRDNIRLLEGRTSDGVILVTKTTDVQNAGRFYQGDRLVYMSEMVSAMVDAMMISGFSAREMHIVYDNNQAVEFFLDESTLVRHESKMTGVLDRFKKNGNGEEETRQSKRSQIVHEKRWGRFVTEYDQGEMRTTTVFERDFVEFIVSEFHEHGFKVASIEAPETAILYTRNMAKFSYNAMNKLVICANNEDTGDLYQFTKDAPAAQRMVHFDTQQGADFAERAVAMLMEEMETKKLYNPYIMLIGDAFKNETYIKACELLSEQGVFVLDTYGTWDDKNAPLNSIRVGASDEVEHQLEGYYGVCLCLLMRELEPKPENMVEGGHVGIIDKNFKNKLSDLALTVAILAIVAVTTLTGINAFEYFMARQEFNQMTNATESALMAAEAKRDGLRSKVDALATIDERYASVLKFVYAQVDKDLNIASVDTEDMMPTVKATGSMYADAEVNAEGEGTENPVPTPDPAEQKTIHIRGYSRTTDGPVKLYTALVGVGLGEVRIVGVEQVELPNGDPLFAFELTVGQN